MSAKSRLRILCEKHGINHEAAKSYKRSHTELTDEQIIDYYLNKCKKGTFKELCERNGISYRAAQCFKSNHNIKTYEETVKQMLARGKTFKDKCIDAGITNTQAAQSYRQSHPELTDEQVIEYYMSYKEKSFSQKCIDAGINPKTGQSAKDSARKKGITLTDEEIIASIANRTKFIEVCKKLGLNIASCSSYKALHTELTDEQIIIHYRPDCWINWLGELVIPT